MKTMLITALAVAGTALSAGVAQAHPGGPVRELDYFQSPSGNIACAVLDGELRCDVGDYTFTPPERPADCPLAWGHAIVLGPTGPAHFGCAGDTVLNADVPVLDYGTQAVSGDYQCESREDGISCATVDGAHGFLLSRDYYSLT